MKEALVVKICFFPQSNPPRVEATMGHRVDGYFIPSRSILLNDDKGCQVIIEDKEPYPITVTYI